MLFSFTDNYNNNFAIISNLRPAKILQESFSQKLEKSSQFSKIMIFKNSFLTGSV